MGTNYYHRTDICPHCNRYKERHIGKSSAGWQFFFRGYNEQVVISSFEDWKRELQAEGRIFDEYGQEISYDDFVKMVEEKQNLKSNLNHYDYCIGEAASRGYDMNNDWKDKEGYSFCSSEFS